MATVTAAISCDNTNLSLLDKLKLATVTDGTNVMINVVTSTASANQLVDCNKQNLGLEDLLNAAFVRVGDSYAFHINT